ncbi:MAG: hypothetical protein HC886_16470 [Leptolyngbyaceae cyanobacterium SM1_1_3]|nr:hypothetical protein [Leptolyngbyaceae cyanobacterium SM1_1_3]NJN02137.1 hypothetical protein [Leptolyngbyaceae cyanobacterium RM1_1_2]
MAGSSFSRNESSAGDAQIWQSLKRAIASSSGFQRWQSEQDAQTSQQMLDQQVRRYLRETLETLAY